MKELLRFIWQHGLISPDSFFTDEGERVEILESGRPNPLTEGPDFLAARIKINGILWNGSVVTGAGSAEWDKYKNNTACNSIILYVTGKAESKAYRPDGSIIPQISIRNLPELAEKQKRLLEKEEGSPCIKVMNELPEQTRREYLKGMLKERLNRRSVQIAGRLEQSGRNWEEAFFCTLARNFGFGINGEAFEQWAQNIRLNITGKHRDNLFQIEALFMGQAGLLSEETIPAYYRESARKEGYFARLSNEYRYLAHKFDLTPIDASLWRFAQLRPGNYPHIRLAQLAALYHRGKVNLSRILEEPTITALRELLRIRPSEYWERHVIFGSTLTDGSRCLSDRSLDLLIINTVIPFLQTYGMYKNNSDLTERAGRLLEELKAEENYIIRYWGARGITARHAADSQALIQLKKVYCDVRACMQCPFGIDYLKS